MVVQKKICLIGEFSVGKTSLVSQFVDSIFSEKYHTTVGVKIDKKQCSIGGSQVNLVIWDLAGESPLKTLKPSQILGASGFLLAADGTRPDTVDLAIALQQKVIQILGPVPFIFALNKADLVAEWSPSMEEITERLTQRGWDVRITSAKTGQGVEKMFLDLAQRMIETSGDGNAGH
ncbi:GTP-binding protein [Granulicella sp. 5B5]|uniref:Rab family GTPase n=1 Tax=Granulicella sp. 5B5 TaxID=1617967 RepID=UPI0015F49C17|nr:Rab family GTPase [Granulicella sp. 5B5]QMV20267.1 GTP-binding protein [Granulicella sp. 5B5]